MCRWGAHETVHCPAGFGGSALPGAEGTGRTEVPVDACIADIVRALNVGGVLTINACCGHGKGDGSILLVDGRELVVRGEADRG